jgi:exodeoxyribonuclease VII large subunit
MERLAADVAPRVLRVGELVEALRGVVEEATGRIWVVGELSNLRRAASGHLYFTLKDEVAQLRAVLFRGDAARLAFEPVDGLEVLAFGEATVYPARGDLQLRVRQLEPRGQGALRLAFDQLRARLEAEGLFDPARKRPLPPFPRTVGVATSVHGAALRDVIRVARLRWPAVPLLVADARVQGDGAEASLIEALQLLAARPDVDVILLVRGGGSLEDLWCFNAEILARALVRCPVPVVAGIGHETDVTIAELVADARASTPSAAAALAVPDRAASRERLARDLRHMHAAVSIRIERARARLAARRAELQGGSPAARLAARRERLARDAHRLRAAWRRRAENAAARLAGRQQALVRGGEVGAALPARRARVTGAARTLFSALAAALDRAGARAALAAGRLDSLSPLGVLARGYAIARRADDGRRIVRDPADVAVGDALSVRVAGGEIDARVTGSRRLPRA